MKKLILLTTIICITAGCTNVLIEAGRKRNLESLAKISDSKFKSSYHEVFSQDEMSAYIKANNDIIVFEQDGFNRSRKGYEDLFNKYIYYEKENDKFNKLYLKTVNSRGSTIKTYKPSLNKIILKEVNFERLSGWKYFTDWDNAIIEYQNGEPISFFATYHAISPPAIGVNIQDRFTCTVVGPMAKSILNNIRNSSFDEFYIKDL